MSGGEFAAIEARANSADDSRGAIQRADIYRIEVPSSFFDRISRSQRDVRDLLAAVRERDNTIARVRAVLDDYDGLDAEPIPKLSTHTWMHEVRAALDPQETH